MTLGPQKPEWDVAVQLHIEQCPQIVCSETLAFGPALYYATAKPLSGAYFTYQANLTKRVTSFFFDDSWTSNS
ncbi:hypothetical protein TNCV_325531 [Trichonephila clavipes]|nr:hypothetical protein TNCV_325531 [Trichonephila clavipes]